MIHLNKDDWKEFEQKFPEAAAWLRAKELRREYEILKRCEADCIKKGIDLPSRAWYWRLQEIKKQYHSQGIVA